MILLLLLLIIIGKFSTFFTCHVVPSVFITAVIFNPRAHRIVLWDMMMWTVDKLMENVPLGHPAASSFLLPVESHESHGGENRCSVDESQLGGWTAPSSWEMGHSQTPTG